MSTKLASQPLRLVCVLLIGVLAQSLVACAPKSATAGSAGPSTPLTVQTTAGASATPTTPAAPGQAVADAGTGVPGGEAVGGDEPSIAYADPAGLFNLQHPRSWGKSIRPGEGIRFTGRDEFINVKIVDTTLSALDFGRSDVSGLAAASPGYQAKPLVAYKVAGTSGAMVAYTWQAGPSPVTGKKVPSSANRYYIPGPAGKLAVFTYSSPDQTYDPAGADDFANAFKWLK